MKKICLLALLFLTAGLLFSKCSDKELQSKEIFNVYLYQADSTFKINNTNSIDSVRFFYNKTKYTVLFSYYLPGQIQQIKGYLLGFNYGHSFLFSEKGQLQEYFFKVGDNLHNSYNLKNNDGNYQEEGKPLVDFLINDPKHKDSLTMIDFLFSTFPRKKIAVSYSVDGKKYSEADLKRSGLMPYLEQAILGIDTHITSKIFFKISTAEPIMTFSGLMDKKQFYDTVNLQNGLQ